ncbi:MAG TPA: serine/threonine-protein kinase [Vicinamibacterales bacterium]|nr:serine/threonine-protein kinase [Vicinamibacterales bacterium]
MTPEQRRRVRDLFEAVIDRVPADRVAVVDREAADDPAVREEVRSLLDHAARAGAFLDQPVLDRVPDLMADEILIPGTVVGAYTIISEIGRGGMGVVYLASDERLVRTVALKALAPQLTRDERQRERLRHEARAAASLTHPGICTVYAFEEIDGQAYIAAEFVDGRTLRDDIRAGTRPTSADVLRAARELASALACAHDRGVTHRDLKPENIMRTGTGVWKILDFGLARMDATASLSAEGTAPGVLVGTPAYMAPEQMKGGQVDRRADVFAFGVVLYEYACGTHPFEAASPLAMMARALEGDLTPLATRRPDLPPAMTGVVDRCLRKAPPDRFQSASEIVGALAAGEAVSASGSATWWRIHQIAVVALYIGAAALGWQLKEWIQMAATTALFMALGIGATIGCVLRGHMLFTERVNRSRLAVERQRTSRAVLAVDIGLAIALTLDALLFVSRPLTSVLTIGLAIGIGLAATVVEPATTRAAFGDS